ncbi:MAG TPA: hypothetical protein VM582_05235, partial [Candidatus Thermoplasmatota archaeon]|nr:hypothetical protein [Candidatus Thermoplasmatota archaeon]
SCSGASGGMAAASSAALPYRSRGEVAVARAMTGSSSFALGVLLREATSAKELEPVIARATATSPRDRYGSAAELAAAIPPLAPEQE